MTAETYLFSGDHPMAEQHHIVAENATKVWNWLQTRGGLAIWASVNLSNPGASWTSPRLDADGQPTRKPTWEAGNEPVRVITDPAEVVVDVPTEVRRFRVAVRMGSQGLTLKLTEASTRKVRRAVEQAGEGSWYTFDGDEAVIWRSLETTPLAAYIERQNRPAVVLE
jgi:hypothetical protein